MAQFTSSNQTNDATENKLNACNNILICIDNDCACYHQREINNVTNNFCGFVFKNIKDITEHNVQLTIVCKKSLLTNLTYLIYILSILG